jgi:hypothetical protein
MNIFTFPLGLKQFYVRPDTSVSEGDSFYAPDGILNFSVVPLAYLKIERAGKSIGQKFAGRHYSCLGYGIHICGENPVSLNSHGTGLSEQYKSVMYNSLDNSTFLSKCTGRGQFDFNKYANGLSSNDFDEMVERASQYLSLRTGDIISVEMPEIKHIDTRTHKSGEKISYGEIAISFIC